MNDEQDLVIGPAEAGRLVHLLHLTHEGSSARAARILRQRGHRAVALEGGIAGWRKAGLPMITREAESLTQLADLCPDCQQPTHAHAFQRPRCLGARRRFITSCVAGRLVITLLLVVLVIGTRVF